MRLSRHLDAEPLIILNMARSYSEMEEWIYYANATVDSTDTYINNKGKIKNVKSLAKKRNTHQAALGMEEGPYNITKWELGNELDGMIARWDDGSLVFPVAKEGVYAIDSLRYYAWVSGAFQELEKAWKNVQNCNPVLENEKIQLIPHSTTEIGPKAMVGPAPWYYKLFKKLKRKGFYGANFSVAVHPYFDGYKIPVSNDEMTMILADLQTFGLPEASRKLSITETGKWKVSGSESPYDCNGSRGAIGTADFYITAAKLAGVRDIYQHHLGAAVLPKGAGVPDSVGGTWWAGYEETIDTGGTHHFTPRPVTKTMYALSRYIYGNVYQTDCLSPNPEYGSDDDIRQRGYDINAVAMQRGGDKRLLIVNRSWDERPTDVTWAGFADGSLTMYSYRADPNSSIDPADPNANPELKEEIIYDESTIATTVTSTFEVTLPAQSIVLLVP